MWSSCCLAKNRKMAYLWHCYLVENANTKVVYLLEDEQTDLFSLEGCCRLGGHGRGSSILDSSWNRKHGYQPHGMQRVANQWKRASYSKVICCKRMIVDCFIKLVEWFFLANLSRQRDQRGGADERAHVFKAVIPTSRRNSCSNAFQQHFKHRELQKLGH